MKNKSEQERRQKIYLKIYEIWDTHNGSRMMIKKSTAAAASV